MIATTCTETEEGVSLGNFMPLVKWYLGDISISNNYDKIGFYPSLEEARRHPNILNICTPLPFDRRFVEDGVAKGSGVPFTDPWKDQDEPAWRSLNDLDFLLWHIKYNLCGGISGAFEYTMQHSFYHFQTRVKPGVIVVFISSQGLGKSAIYGHNASGPGVMFRIYGDKSSKYSNIDQLLKDFNGDAEGKLYCALEEVRPGKGSRNNDQLKDKITEGTMRVEKKGIDPFWLPDHRIFYAMSQHAAAFEIEKGDRRIQLNKGRDTYTQGSVDSGALTRDEYRSFCVRLNDVKNSDDTAYGFFKMGMEADLRNFNVHVPYMTDIKEQQQEACECRVLKFIKEIRIGEFQLGDVKYRDGWAVDIEVKDLWDWFGLWHRQSYAREWIVPESKVGFAIRISALTESESFVKKTRKGAGVRYHIEVDEGVRGDF